MTKVKKEIEKLLSVKQKINQILKYHTESEDDFWIPVESIERQRKFQGPRRAEMVQSKK
ncbi:MAG: hypothetical protein GX640_04610 [Fibrobacter sp.]|nr:hypothetical protein [Fibrobacter sp.]